MIPENWDEWEPFRATLLLYFTPQHAATLQRMGVMLCELALLHEYQEQRIDGEALPVARLRAVAADLRYLSGFLEVEAAQQTESGLTRDEILLSQRAAELSRELRRLTADLERAIAPT